MDDYDYYYTSNGLKEPVKMYINYVDTTKAKNRGFDTEYELSPISFGPFENGEGFTFIDIVDTFSLVYKLIHHLDHNVKTSSTCFT